MKKMWLVLPCQLLLAGLLVTGCQTGVVNTVLVHWGIRQAPEGTPNETDKIFNKLASVGEIEIKRMNQENQRGKILFQDKGDMRGKYYKESKVYENYFPVDVETASRVRGEDQGFVGFIEYSYRIYQSERKTNRTEAEAQAPCIPTDQTGRERYRYAFGPTGEWNSRKGQRARE